MTPHGHPGSTRLPWRVLVPVAIASAALGMVFGGMEVVVVAFAKEAGVLPYAGVILMAWAFGSLVAGVVTGTITWRASPARRFRVGAVMLALSLLPLPFVSHPVVVALLLILSGMAIAPTLIASVAVTQSAVDQSRLTEALAWTSTGMAAGVAAGAAAVGQVIDSSGAQAGFVGVAIAGLLLIDQRRCSFAGRALAQMPIRCAPQLWIQTRQVRPQLSHRVRRSEPGTDDLVQTQQLCCGRGASDLPAPYSAVVTLVTEAASRPRAAKTARAMSAQVIGSPSLLRL